ncbi:uncharacterized protein BCR38DRAFT_459606 [Pseudomassariella vexata]|uniref:IMD domain-containing protein n=1 Tax=Pseudomassariella vexata TaxID=1141098 RepID=A0A1Y2DML4_9PEZI|nr:uncharacterized protein BCR38DRAFT_459606 [Pseudomassariella vexata]ORY60538.1 hypothetical protein BCR38DRAFT_459606 [Pseudomassariella vexata]
MTSRADRPPSPSPSHLPPIPDSPTCSYASTANHLSSYNLPLPPPPRPPHAVLTKADLEASQTAYSDLLATAKTYRQALAALSSSASAFGSSLEACARLKESRADTLGPPGGASLSNSFTTNGTCTADLLLAASGVHHLVANHQQILSETVYRSFEVPLLHELDKWRGSIDDEDESYHREVKVRSREIRRMEKEGLKLHKQRRRDVGKFREHLVELTGKLDGLTTLHGEHARALLRESQETSVKIVDASCSLVRAEVDIFESLARKGWSGGGLDELLEKGRDLFASDDDVLVVAGGVVGAGSSAVAAGEGAKLFSILPPKSILADSASDSGRGKGHGRADSLMVEPERYQSLAGAMDRDRDRGDAESIFSEFNQSRGVRPFSPQPIRRNPTDVILDPDSLFQGEGGAEGARDLGATAAFRDAAAGARCGFQQVTCLLVNNQ